MSVASRTVFVGDDLPVLRGMEAESVDMVYADPPFNSNRSYAAPIGSKAAGAMFRDTWTLNDVDVACRERSAGLRRMFAFQGALILAIAAKLFGIV